ncbi:hypothetical protein ABFX02_06G022200 [Erythranthe guttata]
MTTMSVVEEEEPASPSARLMQTPGFDICVYAVLGYMTAIDVDLFKNELELTLVKHPRFSSLLIEKDKKRGNYSWKRTIVDIDKHVFVPDLDPDMENPDEFVENFTSGLSRKTLDPTRPLWEIHILNVKTSDANSTVIFKIDHSIGDGVSLISLVLACAAMHSSGGDLLPVLPSKKRKTNSIGDRNSNIGSKMKRLFLSAWTILLVVFYTLVDLIMLLATMLFLKDTKTPIKGERGVENTPKRFVHRILNLDDVKLVKTAMHVSINDVLMGVTEAGLSRYLDTRYATTEKQHTENGAEIKKSKNTLPRNIRLRAGIAFNLRPSPSIKDLIEVMDEKKELKGMWGNLVGLVLIPLTIALEDDPLAYIRRAKSIMDRKKLSLGPNFIFMLLKLLINLFGTKAALLVTRAVFTKTTVGFSNVVGPQEEIKLFGHPLSYISPTVSGFPLSLVIHYQSYGNKLIIALAADEKLIPNPHQLCDDLQNSLQDIKQTVIKRGLVVMV